MEEWAVRSVIQDFPHGHSNCHQNQISVLHHTALEDVSVPWISPQKLEFGETGFLPQKKSKGVIKAINKNKPWGFLWPQNFVHPDIFYLKTRLWYDPIYVTKGRGFYGGVLLSWENFLRGSWETPGSATFCGASNGIVPGMTSKGLKLKPTCCWWEISSWKMGFYHRHETKKQQNLFFLIFQTMDCVFQCKIYVENQFT